MVFECSQSSQTCSGSEDVTWSKTTLEDSLSSCDDSVGMVFAMHAPGPALIPSSHLKKPGWLHTALIPDLDQRIPVMFMLIVGQYEHLNSSSPWTFTKVSLPDRYMKSLPVYFFFCVALIISRSYSIVILYHLLVFLFSVNCLWCCVINLFATRNFFPLGFLHIMLCLTRVIMNIYLQWSFDRRI